MLNIYIIIHIFCVIYCLWRINKRYNKVSLDGVIGVTPGLDTVIIVLLAPILAIIDITVTWINMIKAYNDKKKSNQ